MAGWGVVGIGGAALARLTSRRLGRAGLALAGALAGLAYGALLDLSVMVSFGGEQSLDRYLALSARSIPFNLAHAAGNAALMAAAGPALVAMLARFRMRSEVVWREPRVRRAGAAGVLALALLGGGWGVSVDGGLARATAGGDGPAERPTATAERAQTSALNASATGAGDARRWLGRAQNRDGGFGAAPREDSNAAMSGWAVLGLEAAGRNPSDVRSRGSTALGYLRGSSGELRSTGDLERSILAVAGAGRDSRRFAGRDLVGELRSRRRGNGSWEGQVNLTAFGVLALRAAGRRGAGVRSAAEWLREAQNADGGWGSRRSAASEPDSTGASIQALAAAPGGRVAVRRGARWLRGAQRGDGGWALVTSAGSNSQSTAWAVQALLAAGTDPAGVETRGRSPLDYLSARQASDGRYRYSRGSDQTPVWVTAQVLLAVERKAFPLDAVPRRPGSDGEGGGDGTGNGGKGGAQEGGGADGSRGSNRGGRSGAGSTSADREVSSSASGNGGGAGATDGGEAGGPEDRQSSSVDTSASGGASLLSPFAAGGASLLDTSTAASVGGTEGGGGGPRASDYALAGLGALAAALLAGFLWYRRSLP
jgi:energy-coupling factor transport system substrate-specific component